MISCAPLMLCPHHSVVANSHSSKTSPVASVLCSLYTVYYVVNYSTLCKLDIRIETWSHCNDQISLRQKIQRFVQMLYWWPIEQNPSVSKHRERRVSSSIPENFPVRDCAPFRRKAAYLTHTILHLLMWSTNGTECGWDTFVLVTVQDIRPTITILTWNHLVHNTHIPPCCTPLFCVNIG